MEIKNCRQSENSESCSLGLGKQVGRKQFSVDSVFRQYSFSFLWSLENLEDLAVEHVTGYLLYLPLYFLFTPQI